jgi:hypothetical protein
LVAGADVLDRWVVDAEVADAVVEWLILETALNAVPIPRRRNKGIDGWIKSITDELSESEESRFPCTSLG